MSNAILEIDTNAIKYNLAYFKSKLHPKTKILAVVKAFSYGSDSVLVSNILEKENVSYLAVAYTQEGIKLRKNGIKTPIIVLHPQIVNFKKLIKHQLEPNIYSFKILSEFLKITDKKNSKNYPIHLKFNTGLNRLGFLENEISKIVFLLKTNKNITIASVFSHLAASEDLLEKEFTQLQIASFIRIKNQFENLLSYKPLYHLLNTSGIINYNNEAQFDMVRLGIGIYGFGNDNKTTNALKNVLTLKSFISQIHKISKGQSVGYNKSFISTKETKIATISIGHADGISRKLGNKNTYVLIKNKKALIIGNVCMDMLMVDVTDIPCKEGDEVILFNSQKKIEEMASKSQTISYELLTMVSQRVKRVVV